MVGDLQVQKKCLGKMRDVIAGGQTVFRASHNMSQPDDATIKYPAIIEARRKSERSPGRGKSTKLSCNRVNETWDFKQRYGMGAFALVFVRTATFERIDG